jgi:hypothetical protein
MKAPICMVCDRWLSEWPPGQDGGGLVSFRDYEPLPEGACGHPRGDEWFCPDHAPAARELTDLDSATALTVLRGRFRPPPHGFLGWLRSLVRKCHQGVAQ